MMERGGEPVLNGSAWTLARPGAPNPPRRRQPAVACLFPGGGLYEANL